MSEQAGFQLAALAVTIGIAIFSGAFTGLIVSRSFFKPPGILFDDAENWDLPSAPTPHLDIENDDPKLPPTIRGLNDSGDDQRDNNA